MNIIMKNWIFTWCVNIICLHQNSLWYHWFHWTFLFYWEEILSLPWHVELALQRDEKSIPVLDHKLLCNVLFNFSTFILPSICDLEHKGLPLAEARLVNGLFIFSPQWRQNGQQRSLQPNYFCKGFYFIANRHSIVTSLELDSLRNIMLSFLSVSLQ